MIPERKYCAVIVAGGKGTRVGGELPKQFQPLLCEPVLMHTLRAFHQYDYRLRIILVLPKAHRELWEELCKRHRFAVPHTVVNGGETRFHSVQNGLNEVTEEETIAIHDGVRPVITSHLIGNCLDTAFEGNTGVIPVVDEANSVRVLTGEGSKPVDRSRLKIVQTPQAFPADALKKAYKVPYNPMFTDDASVAEHAGIPVRLIKGEETNVKITTPFDLIIAEQYLQRLAKR